MTWQPIETAPKDGTPILIAQENVGAIRWAVWSEGFFRDGIIEAGGRMSLPRPTHWMPLPEPPQLPAKP